MFKFRLRLHLATLLLAVSLLLIFLHYFKILSPFEDFLVKILNPAQHFILSITNKINPGENDKSVEVRKLIIENERLRVLVEECQSLKKQLEFLQTSDFQYVMAKVLSREMMGGVAGLVIEAGKNQGLMTGLPVIFEEGILVGKVSEVNNNFAKVILLTDNHSETAAAWSDNPQTIGVVSGEYGLNMKMELIPKEAGVKIGEIVVTSGIEPNIPRGLVIGEIARFEEAGDGFFRTAYLNSLISLNKINVVSVLIPPHAK